MQGLVAAGLYEYVSVTPADWCFIVSGASAAAFLVLLLVSWTR